MDCIHENQLITSQFVANDFILQSVSNFFSYIVFLTSCNPVQGEEPYWTLGPSLDLSSNGDSKLD